MIKKGDKVTFRNVENHLISYWTVANIRNWHGGGKECFLMNDETIKRVNGSQLRKLNDHEIKLIKNGNAI